MKIITSFLMCCILFISCPKKENLNNVNYEEARPEKIYLDILEQEMQKPNVSYIFDIDSFRYLDEFPRTITGIKAIYPDEPFEERVFENTGKGPLGNYIYTLRTNNIWFSFWGDTIEDANLLVVEIFDEKYQCENMQVIGMSAEELEKVSGKMLTRDMTIREFTELYILVIQTKDGVVTKYMILEQL